MLTWKHRYNYEDYVNVWYSYQLLSWRLIEPRIWLSLKHRYNYEDDLEYDIPINDAWGAANSTQLQLSHGACESWRVL